MRILALFFSIILLLSSCYSNAILDKNAVSEQQIKPLTIFLVRHAEKKSGNNPALTIEGQQRAKKLAAMLEKVELDAVFSTNYKRTQATAAPTAAIHQLDILDYSPRELKAFSAMLENDYAGKNILVVGHSNTTPTLCGLLENNPAYDAFDESDYGNLIIITIADDGRKAVFLRF